MLQSTVRRRRQKDKKQTQAMQMVEQIKKHPAWKGDLTLTEMQVLLQGKEPYTIALSQGIDKHHFFLSYVNTDGETHHRNIRILRVHGKWGFKNGWSQMFYPCVTELDPNGSIPISNLIAYCLKCSTEVCKTLV